MIVDKPGTPMVVYILVELFREEEPQDKPTLLPATSLTSSLLVLLLEELDLGMLADDIILLGFLSPSATPTFTAAPLLLYLTPVTIHPAIEPSMEG